MPDSLPPTTLPLILNLILLVGLALLGAWCSRLGRRLDVLGRHLEECWQDVSVLRGALHGLVEDRRRGDRDGELQARLRELEARQEQLMRSDAQTGHYLQAVRQAERGSSAEDLMTAHDLTRGEAELILRLHGRPQKSPG